MEAGLKSARTAAGFLLCAFLFTGLGFLFEGALSGRLEANSGPTSTLYLRLSIIAFCVVALAFLIRPVIGNTRSVAGVACLLGLLWLCGTGGVTLLDPGAGFSARLSCAALLINVLLGVGCALLLRDPIKACGALLATVVVDAVICLAFTAMHRDGLWSGQTFRTAAGLGNPLELSTLLSVTLVCVALNAASREENRRFMSLIAGLLAVAMVCCWTRNAVIAATVTLACGLWLAGKRPLAVVTTLAGVVLFLVTGGVRASGAGSASLARSDEGRITQIRLAWEAFLSRPLGGYGPGGYVLAHHFSPVMGKGIEQVGTSDTKNVFLTLLCSYGAVGGLIALILAYMTVANLVQSKSDIALRFIIPAATCLVLSGLVDEPFLNPLRPVGNRLVGFLIGLVLLDASRPRAASFPGGDLT